MAGAGGGGGRRAIFVFKDTPTAFPHFNTLPSSSSNIQKCCKCAEFFQMDFLFLGIYSCVCSDRLCIATLAPKQRTSDLTKELLDILYLICNKTMQVPHSRGKVWENLRTTEGHAIFSSHVPLQMLIPDSAWVPSHEQVLPVNQSMHAGQTKGVLLAIL